MSGRPSARRHLATAFLLAGIAGIGTWAWSVGHQLVYEEWSNRSFDRQVESHNLAPEQPADDGLIGRLSIPRLGVRAVVREGTESGILSVALGHIVGTALPGQQGNFAVAGHRDTLFRGLRNVRLGDQIEFETPGGGKYIYEVENTSIVSPAQVSVLKAGLHPQLTLVTCYPFYYVGSAPYRFIVKARQLGVDEKPAKPLMVADKQPAPIRPTHRIPMIPMTPMPYKEP